MRTLLALIFFCFTLSACAQVNIVPQVPSGAQLGADTQSVTMQQEEVAVTLRVAAAQVRPSPVEQNYASFWVEVVNQRSEALPVSIQNFILLDADGRQSAAQSPDDLVALLKPEMPYLMPSPYVGYYYLGDAERARAADSFRSQSSYAGSRRPDYIKLDALPEGELLPHAKVAGMIYFAAELTNLPGFELRYQPTPLSGRESLPFIFRFAVEKN